VGGESPQRPNGLLTSATRARRASIFRNGAAIYTVSLSVVDHAPSLQAADASQQLVIH